jgi:hypothetical protein
VRETKQHAHSGERHLGQDQKVLQPLGAALARQVLARVASGLALLLLQQRPVILTSSRPRIQAPALLITSVFSSAP